MAFEVDQLTRRVHRRARELGIDLQDVAAQMGITKGRLSQIIKKDRLPEPQFRRLSEALQLSDEEWQTPLAKRVTKVDGYTWVRHRLRKKLERLQGKERDK